MAELIETPGPGHGDSRLPVPDPTLLTTGQIRLAITNVRELLDAERRVLVSRLDASDKAVQLVRDDYLRIPELIRSDLHHEREVFQAKLDGIKDLTIEKFTALATLTDKLSLANATALTAALSAAEKAVGEQNRSSSLAITKSEQGMQEALKQLQTTFQTEIKGITALMATMQSRLDRGEGNERGASSQRTEHRADSGLIVGIISAVIAGLAVASAVLAIAAHHV